MLSIKLRVFRPIKRVVGTYLRNVLTNNTHCTGKMQVNDSGGSTVGSCVGLLPTGIMTSVIHKSQETCPCRHKHAGAPAAGTDFYYMSRCHERG